jgi:Lectin C-type domain
VAALLLAVACGSPANISALFAASATPAAGASSGGGASDSSDGHAGTSPAAGSGSGTPGSAGSAGMANGGFSRGGADTGGAGGNSSGGAQNGGAVAGGPPMGGTAGTSSLGDCSMFGTDATYYSTNQHCYLAVHDAANFADAKSHCMNLGGHLVTLSDQQENDFVWGLDTNAHWIGATDGKDPKEPNPGTYTWVDGEPFTYTDWSAGQPNATMTTCPQGTNGGGACYEHCAFQWSGGATPGEWNDQLCLNAIEAVCEWDN